MKKYTRPSKAQITALALTMMAIGGGSYGMMAAANSAAAQTAQNQVTVAPADAEVNDTATGATETSTANDQADPSLQGSIQVAPEAAGTELSKADESAQYASLAKISAAQAQQLAEANVGGTATKVRLGDENGSLIYEVRIGTSEVKVDAGNGAILKVESGDTEGSEQGGEPADVGGKEGTGTETNND